MLSSSRSSALRILVPRHKLPRPALTRRNRIVIHNYNGWRSFTSSPSQSSQSHNKNNNRSATQAKKDYEFCVDLVQNRDRESYLCGLLLPANARRSYFAIRAFNVELASIKDGSVSRKVGGAQFDNDSGASMALKIRLQWWRQALNTIYSEEEDGGDTGDLSSSSDPLLDSMIRSSWNNPVVRELDTAVHQSQLTRRFLERLVEAREIDLDVRQFNTMNEQIQYAENTFSSLLYLSLECTNVS
jgi:NADH dehydrogenase [ubiquinone] 1 alpha subcomplex assembly factor 6